MGTWLAGASPAQQCGDFPIEIERGSILISFVVSVMTFGKRSGMWCGAKMLPSTGRQLQLFAAFGAPPPAYLHHPLLCDEAGNKLSKRQHTCTASVLD